MLGGSFPQRCGWAEGGLWPRQPHGRAQGLNGAKPSVQGEEGNPPHLQGQRGKLLFWLLILHKGENFQVPEQLVWRPALSVGGVASMSVCCTFPGVHRPAGPPALSTDSMVIPPWPSVHGHPFMAIPPGSSLHGHPPMVIPPGSFPHGHFPMVISSMVIPPWSSLHGHPSRVILTWSSFCGHPSRGSPGPCPFLPPRASPTLAPRSPVPPVNPFQEGHAPGRVVAEGCPAP